MGSEMMDIVERLHDSPFGGDIGRAHELCVEAANEIERQRLAYNHLWDEKERMRGALIRIFAFYPISLNEPNKTIRAMQEVAKRGLKGEE